MPDPVFVRIRVQHDVGMFHGAQRDVTQRGLRRIDDLVRLLRVRRRTDKITGTQRVLLAGMPQRAFAFDDVEEFLVCVMTVIRSCPFAGLQPHHRVAEFFAANLVRHRGAFRAELLAFAEFGVLQFIKVHNNS